MKVKVGDKTYQHDPDRLLVSDAILVKKLTGGMTVPQFQMGLLGDDPEAMKALVFVLMRRAGEDPDWDTLDFDWAELEITADAVDAGEPAPKEDGPSGSEIGTPEPPETAT